MYRLSEDENKLLAELVRASFTSPEAAESALGLLPELVRLTEHLLQKADDVARLAEILHPILMALPTFPLHEPGDELCLYDLAPLELAAHRANDLTGLLRAFLPGRSQVTLAGFMQRYQGASQPFNVPSEFYQAELAVDAPGAAARILNQLGLRSLPPDLSQGTIATIAGVHVWINLVPAGEQAVRLVLEVHDPVTPYAVTRQAFLYARKVNQVILKYLLNESPR
ncbi:MAG: hypothetical protein ACYC6L_06640 [Anaerolineae bacterium]